MWLLLAIQLSLVSPDIQNVEIHPVSYTSLQECRKEIQRITVVYDEENKEIPREITMVCQRFNGRGI